MSRVRDQVTLVVPARPEMWAVARMTASAVVSRLDFTFEGIEDLRLGVTEMCSSCAVGAEADARCDVRFEVSNDRIEMYLEVAPVSESAISPAPNQGMSLLELSEQILLATVDSHTISPVEGGIRRGYLRKDCDAVALQ
jgi:hypothetical protein